MAATHPTRAPLSPAHLLGVEGCHQPALLLFQGIQQEIDGGGELDRRLATWRRRPATGPCRHRRRLQRHVERRRQQRCQLRWEGPHLLLLLLLRGRRFWSAAAAVGFSPSCCCSLF